MTEDTPPRLTVDIRCTEQVSHCRLTFPETGINGKNEARNQLRAFRVSPAIRNKLLYCLSFQDTGVLITESLMLGSMGLDLAAIQADAV